METGLKKNRKLFCLIKAIDYKTLIIILGIFLLLTVFLSVGLGPVKVSPSITFKVIMSKIPYFTGKIQATWTQTEESIVMLLRLPRVLLGVIVGASLAVTGVCMQALVRNHLADPFILGVSSGASAFATLGMLFGVFKFLGIYSLAISAFVGAAFTIIIVYMLSRVRGRINITHLLLSGLAISMIMDGLTRVIVLSAPNALGLHNATFWMSGSLASAKWAYLTLPLVVMLVCLVILILNYRALNALLMGEDTATNLGYNTAFLHKLLVLIASVLAGATISVSGCIGFIGLMCPHLARILVGSDHKKVLPVSALIGGILVVWTDVAARLIIAPEELPLGILTAIIGGPMFIVLLKKNRRA